MYNPEPEALLSGDRARENNSNSTSLTVASWFTSGQLTAHYMCLSMAARASSTESRHGDRARAVDAFQAARRFALAGADAAPGPEPAREDHLAISAGQQQNAPSNSGVPRRVLTWR